MTTRTALAGLIEISGTESKKAKQPEAFQRSVDFPAVFDVTAAGRSFFLWLRGAVGEQRTCSAFSTSIVHIWWNLCKRRVKTLNTGG